MEEHGDWHYAADFAEMVMNPVAFANRQPLIRLSSYRQCFYLPIKVNIATPRARSPRMMDGNASPNAESPYKRKKRIRHQVAIEFGILISFSFGN
jgi:hypothetical protein